MEVLKPFRFAVAETILKGYHFDLPFQRYFSGLCRQHKEWGSRDRKIYRELCYSFLRLGHALSATDAANIQKAWDIIHGKIPVPASTEIFPYADIISRKADYEAWVKGMMRQRPVHLAVIRGKYNFIGDYLLRKNISFLNENEKLLTLAADTNCDELVQNGWAWIMDKSSQKAAEAISVNEFDRVWDACCGSGGKSLFLKNKFSANFQLMCTDIRPSVIRNLQKRFSDAGFPLPDTGVIDLEREVLSDKFDIIILDVPCTGSGTWGRNPEHLKAFKSGDEMQYAEKQKKIVTNAWNSLKPGGMLYYITCSVFHAENEDNIASLSDSLPAEASAMHYTGSGTEDSDTLFVAELRHRMS